MRNLKKVLTLVLTLAMLLSVMVVGAGAAFTDQESIGNKEAVDMCTALNIIGGYEDGSFRPAGNVTRAEMCKMICVALNGGKEPNMGSNLINTFNDVAKDHWAAPYVEYCVSQGIVGGVGGGNFNPNGNITGTQAAKMLLCILGYNASIQGYIGNDFWETKINVDAAQKGLYEGLADIDASAALTRDQAAQMIWNALQANEVEYVTTLVTGPDGTLVSKVTVQDKVSNDDLKTKITLLADKYKALVKYGYMTKVEYSDVKGEYTYTFVDAANTFGGAVITTDNYSGKLTTTKDYSDLFGQKVAVVYKDNNDKTVYGMYAESTVLASDIVGNITNTSGNPVASGDTQIKIGDVKFKMENTTGTTVNDIDVYTYNTAATAKLPSFSATGYYSIDAIDHTGDNKIDCFVVYPIDVQQVTYVGTASINAGASYSYDKDSKLYSNGGFDYNFPTVSKDEWVAIDQYSVTDMPRNVSVLDKVEGEVTALKDTDVQIGGVWYEKVSGTTPSVGDNVALTVVGNYYFDVEVIDSKSLDNVLMVLDAGNNSSGLGSGVEAKVMYAKDGSVATISKISKVDGTSATIGTTYAAGKVVAGALYTYKEKDGAVELTMLADDVIGDSKFISAATNRFEADNVKPTVDSKVISDDAVVMVYDKGSDKYSFTTGAVLKTWKDDFGNTAQYLYETVNGLPTVTAVALYATATEIPGVSGSTGYGYVTTSAYYTEIDDTDYAVLTVWTADGELANVKADSIWDPNKPSAAGFVDPSPANVKTLDAVKEGSFITFEKLADGNISDLKVVGTSYAMIGTYVNKDNETELTLGDNVNADVTMTVTKDTQIIYVNTEDKIGAEGSGDLSKSLANETSVDGKYFLNVVVEGTPSDDADVVFVDVNNKLDGVAMTFSLGASATPADINGALGNGDVTAAATTVNAALSVPAGRTLTLTGAADMTNGSISVAATGTLTIDGGCTNVAAKAITGANGATVTTGASGALATADNFFAAATASGSGELTGSTPAVSSTYVWTTWTYTNEDDSSTTQMSGWVLVP